MCINDYQLIIQPRVTASYTYKYISTTFFALGGYAMPVQYEAKGSKHALSIIDSTKWTRNLAPKCIYLLNAYDRINESNMSWWTIRCKKCGWIGFFPNYGFRFVALSCARVWKVCKDLALLFIGLQGATAPTSVRGQWSYLWFGMGYQGWSPWRTCRFLCWVLTRCCSLLVDGDILSDNLLISACWMRGDAFWLLSCVKAHITRHDKTLKTIASH